MATNEAKIIIVADDKASSKLTGIGDKAKQMRGAFLAVGAAGAAAAGSVALSIKSFAQAGDEIQKMALRTGLTTESLSELKFALEQSGSNIEGFEKGIRRMSSFIQDGRDGLTETTRALDTLGLSVAQFEGASPEAAFEMLSGALAGVEDDLAQAALAQDIFGRSGTALLPLLAQGADGIEALKQEAQELGIVFDQDAANSAARLVDAQNTLSQSIRGVQFALAEGLAPALSGFLEGAGKVISRVTDWARENPVLTQVIVGFTGALGLLAVAIAGIGLALPIVTAGLGAVTVGFIGLNVATGGLLLAIGALGAGLVLLVKNWDTVVEAIRVGVNFMLGAVETYVNGWIQGLNIIIGGINKLGSVFGLSIDTIAEVELPRWRKSMKETEEAIGESGDAIIDENEQIANSFTATAETAEEAAERILKAQSEQVQQHIADSKLMGELDQQLRESAQAVLDGRIADIIAHQDKRAALDQALADKRIEIQEETLARELNLFETRQDALEAAAAGNKAAFAAIKAEIDAAPSVIAAGPSIGGAEAIADRRSVFGLFKASQNRVEDELAAARALLVSGEFGGGTTAAMVQAEIDRLTGITQSSQFRGDRLGELFAPEGGFGSAGPPVLPGQVFGEGVPGVTVVVEGSVIAEDLPSVIERGLQELGYRGGASATQSFME